jgi:hypothetical protein
MSRLHSLTLQEKNALAVLADAVDRCRKEDMQIPEVLASLELLARRTSIGWPFEQFRNLCSSLTAILRALKGDGRMCMRH